MTLLLLVGSCALSAMWFRPWRARPRVPHNPNRAAPKHRLAASGASQSSGTVVSGTVLGTPRAALVAVIIGVALVGILQPVLVVPLLFVFAVVVVRSRRPRTTDSAEVAKALPEVVDLLLVGVGAGYTPRQTLHRCQAWLPTPFATAVRNSLARADAGATFLEALDTEMTPLGDRVRPLVAALNTGERDGSTLAIGLLRVSDEARRKRRLAAQERARRIPVAMLGPLLLCVLPSFALLTIVPLVLGSLSDLGVVI